MPLLLIYIPQFKVYLFLVICRLNIWPKKEKKMTNGWKGEKFILVSKQVRKQL